MSDDPNWLYDQLTKLNDKITELTKIVAAHQTIFKLIGGLIATLFAALVPIGISAIATAWKVFVSGGGNTP